VFNQNCRCHSGVAQRPGKVVTETTTRIFDRVTTLVSARARRRQNHVTKVFASAKFRIASPQGKNNDYAW
jgi:hypothetical protein